MAKFLTTIPFTGAIQVEIEAEDGAKAISKASDLEITTDNIFCLHYHGEVMLAEIEHTEAVAIRLPDNF